jgi:hypothetical protein
MAELEKYIAVALWKAWKRVRMIKNDPTSPHFKDTKMK